MTRAAEEAAALRIAAGAFGITLQGVMLFRRSPFHQLHLADQFGGRRFPSVDVLRPLSSRLEAAGLDPAMVQAKLFAIIKQQSAILALNDAFLMASYLFLGLAGLVWLAHPTHRPLHPKPAADLRQTRAEELMEQP
jgi:DHA2 family multidrug resistance protein